jgi:hypothetical protein
MRSTVTKNTVKALLCRPIVPSIKTLAGTLILVGTTALPVLACGSPGAEGALILLAYPLGVVALLYGLPLLLSVAIESAILHHRESVGWPKSFGLSLLTNIGGLIVVVVGTITSFASFLGFITLAFQGGILGLMLTVFCRKTGYFLGLTKGLGQIGVYLFFIGMSYGSLALDRIVETSKEPATLLPPIAGLLLIGFLFNLVVEGWILAQLMPKLRPQLAATVVSMNVWSYGLLPASMLLSSYFTGKPLLTF